MILMLIVAMAAVAAWLLIPKAESRGEKREASESRFRENARDERPLAPTAHSPHAAATEEKLAIVDATIRERYAKKFRNEVLTELKELTEDDA